MAEVTLQGAAAATGASGLLLIIIDSELKRRNIVMDPKELLAIMGLLGPAVHTTARVIHAIIRAAVRRWIGVDIDQPDGEATGPLAGK